jgi:hypothetical protein
VILAALYWENMLLQNELLLKPLRLVLLFTSLGILFWNFPIKYANFIWWILVAAALGWLIIELRDYREKNVRRAVEVGIFLMLFDFFVENLGKIAGLWESYGSVYFVLAVPIEVMLLALIGGTAWALYQPRRFRSLYSLADITVFATFGTIGEYILGIKGLLIYMGEWTSAHAFLGYALTWVLLHSILYFHVHEAPVRKQHQVIN